MLAKASRTMDNGLSGSQWVPQKPWGASEAGSVVGSPGGLLDVDCTEEAPRQAPRIMVVDDNAVNHLVISRMLQSVGMEVLSAMSGTEALQKLGEPSDDLPDLLIMDVMMPGLSGLDLCRHAPPMNSFYLVDVMMCVWVDLIDVCT